MYHLLSTMRARTENILTVVGTGAVIFGIAFGAKELDHYTQDSKPTAEHYVLTDEQQLAARKRSIERLGPKCLPLIQGYAEGTSTSAYTTTLTTYTDCRGTEAEVKGDLTGYLQDSSNLASDQHDLRTSIQQASSTTGDRLLSAAELAVAIDAGVFLVLGFIAGIEDGQ